MSYATPGNGVSHIYGIEKQAVQSDTGATLAAKLAGCYNWVGPARELFNLLFM